MRRLISAVFISIVSMSVILGALPAFAQTGENEKEVPVSSQRSSDNQTTPQVFAVNNELMEELDRLVRMFDEADDQELIKELQEKIQVVKEEIRKASEKPTVVAVPTQTQVVVEKPRVISGEEEPSPPRVVIGPPVHPGELSLTQVVVEKPTAVGSSQETGVNSTPISPTETSPIEFVPPRPVAVQSGGEITDYYRHRIAEIATEEVAVEEQIASLKELRNEIDKLIEELIKNRAEISAEEVSGLVEIIEVRPGEVRMDKVVVKTVDKSVVARIDNKELAIKPTEAQVIIHDENLEVKAPELSIENEVLRVGDSEVNLRPTAVIEKINIEPKEIELREENAQAVYKVKADESRKLFGFIPMKVETTLTVDAASTEANIIKEEKPWWAFFTTK